jgi:ADP-ribosyltransferase of polymorphic toxin system
VLRRSLLLAWLIAILGILAPSIASAAPTANLETRVKAFELVVPPLVGRSTARTPEKHRERSNAYHGIASGSPLAAEGAAGGAEARSLFHYTNEAGHAGIIESEALNPSLKAVNPADVRYGNGQYLSDIVPGTQTPAQLSRQFLGMPFQGSRFAHFVEIDVGGLNVVRGRSGVFVVPNEVPLDQTGRILGSGPVP